METSLSTKTCKACKEELPIHHFGVGISNKDNYHTLCKTCHNAYNRLIRRPDTPLYEVPWPIANRHALKRLLGSNESHTFKTQCNKTLIIDFSHPNMDISLLNDKGELVVLYRAVESTQKQVIKFIDNVLHNETIKLIV